MKKIVSLFLSFSLILSLTTTAFATNVTTNGGSQNVPVELTQDSTTFSVTVPTVLPVSVGGMGEVTVSTNNKIVNNSFGPVEVKSVKVDPQNDWELFAFNTDFKQLKVGSKSFGFQINGMNVNTSGNCLANFDIIEGNSEISFTYDAKIAPQNREISRESIANVVFTIGWYTDDNVSGGSGNNGDSGDPVLYGGGQTYHKMAPSSLSFRSTAPLNEFQEVLVNGEVVDPSNYTLTEGSTIVTFDIDYLDSLDIDGYEITVVSDSGSPSTDFEVITSEQDDSGFFYYNQPYYAGYIEVGDDPMMLNFNGTVSFIISEDNTVKYINYDSENFGEGSISYENGTYIITIYDVEFSGYFSNNGKTFIGTSVYAPAYAPFCGEYNGPGIDFILNNERAVSDDEYLYICDEWSDYWKVMPLDETKSTYAPIKSNINDVPVLEFASAAFYGNENLTTAPVIPMGIETISYYTFYECKNLRTVTIPKTVTEIEPYAFYMCLNLNTINFEGTVEQWNAITKGKDWAFRVPATEVICKDGVASLS